MTEIIPVDLFELADRKFPDRLADEWIAVSETVYVLWIYDLDYSYTTWMCARADDGRWSLNPAPGVKVVEVDEGEG